jgi:hypothetical protein
MIRLSYLFFLLLSPDVWAAPCCGGTSLLPSLITGDDCAQISFSLTQEAIVADALDNGTVLNRSSDDLDRTLTFKLSAAYRFWNRFQAGIDIPVAYRNVDINGQGSSATGLGDIGLQAGFEFLPELAYSVWKPRGFVFTRLTLPTGKSPYDLSNPTDPDDFGRGFLSIALGALLQKTVGDFDFWLMGEGHWIAPGTFSSIVPSSLAGVIPVQQNFSSGWGASGLLAAGYSPLGGIFRLGVSLSPIYEGEQTVTSLISTVAPPRVSWNAGIQASIQISDEWTTSLNYVDQTWIGQSRNNSLSRSISLLILKRFLL